MYTLPMHPTEATRIGDSSFSFAFVEGRMVYFSNLEPFDFHDECDRGAMLIRIAKFAEAGVGRPDLAAAFGVGRSTIQRAVNRLRRSGEASFHVPRRGRGPSVLSGEMKAEANRLLASGLSGAAVARQLGVATATLNYNRRKGWIGEGLPASQRSAAAAVPDEAELPEAAASRVAEEGTGVGPRIPGTMIHRKYRLDGRLAGGRRRFRLH